MESNVDTKSKDNKSSKGVNVLFYCTTLEKDSLLIENYYFIKYKLCDVFDKWAELEKNTYFLDRKGSQEQLEDRFGIDLIRKDNYKFQGIQKGWILNYIKSSESKFDMLVWIDASNLVDIFYEEKSIRSLFDDDIKSLYERIKDLYHGIKPNGVLVNIYYNEVGDTIGYAPFEMFYSYSCIWSLDVYLFLLKIMNRLFEKMEPGVYQKRQVENLDTLIPECYNQVLEELFNLCLDKLENPKELVQAIDKTYFNGSLQKNAKYNFERPITSNISNLIEEMLKMED